MSKLCLVKLLSTAMILFVSSCSVSHNITENSDSDILVKDIQEDLTSQDDTLVFSVDDTEETTDTSNKAPNMTAEGIDINMGRVFGGLTCPTGDTDQGTPATIPYTYLIGRTEVTYELWQAVYTWATTVASPAYYFENQGSRGSNGTGTDQQPVTNINWRDAMVFCNAITEWYNASNGTTETTVYNDSGVPIRDSRYSNATQCDTVVETPGATGFRLLSNDEFEMAARWKGHDSSNGAIEMPVGSGQWWTPGNYASGATANIYNATATQAVSWYDANSGGHTHDVGTLAMNKLALYDMSGNVQEWVFDSYPYAFFRCARVGNSSYNSFEMQIGVYSCTYPYGKFNTRGFRLGKTETF